MSDFIDVIQNIESRRVAGYLEGPAMGPILIILTGIHGNEPAGIEAAETFIEEAKKLQKRACGSIVVLKGHLQAIEAGKRFLDKDLNRMFKPETIKQAQNSQPGQPDYLREYEELLPLTEAINEIAKLTDELYFLDCHTVSAESMPFISLTEEASCEALAQKIPVFSVVGEHREPRGYTDEYFVALGGAGFTYESGQHEDKSSVRKPRSSYVATGSSYRLSAFRCLRF